MSGTAIAQGVLITSPDQLGSGVVTGPKILAGSVTGSKIARSTIIDIRLSDPVLTAHAASDGSESDSGVSVAKTGRAPTT
jgi:hypothetical protein